MEQGGKMTSSVEQGGVAMSIAKQGEQSNVQSGPWWRPRQNKETKAPRVLLGC